jgi:hypothetical protein
MAGRKIVDEADARACLGAVASSGRTRVDWARAHGVDARSLNAWRMNLERRERLVQDRPLRLVELVQPTATPRPGGSGVRVRAGGVVVELDRDFDMEVLVAVLDVVAPC